MTLPEFLLARIAEDEHQAHYLDDHHRRAELVGTESWVTDDPGVSVTPRAGCWPSARPSGGS